MASRRRTWSFPLGRPEDRPRRTHNHRGSSQCYQSGTTSCDRRTTGGLSPTVADNRRDQVMDIVLDLKLELDKWGKMMKESLEEQRKSIKKMREHMETYGKSIEAYGKSIEETREEKKLSFQEAREKIAEIFKKKSNTISEEEKEKGEEDVTTTKLVVVVTEEGEGKKMEKGNIEEEKVNCKRFSLIVDNLKGGSAWNGGDYGGCRRATFPKNYGAHSTAALVASGECFGVGCDFGGGFKGGFEGGCKGSDGCPSHGGFEGGFKGGGTRGGYSSGGSLAVFTGSSEGGYVVFLGFEGGFKGGSCYGGGCYGDGGVSKWLQVSVSSDHYGTVSNGKLRCIRFGYGGGFKGGGGSGGGSWSYEYFCFFEDKKIKLIREEDGCFWFECAHCMSKDKGKLVFLMSNDVALHSSHELCTNLCAVIVGNNELMNDVTFHYLSYLKMKIGVRCQVVVPLLPHGFCTRNKTSNTNLFLPLILDSSELIEPCHSTFNSDEILHLLAKAISILFTINPSNFCLQSNDIPIIQLFNWWQVGINAVEKNQHSCIRMVSSVPINNATFMPNSTLSKAWYSVYADDILNGCVAAGYLGPFKSPLWIVEADYYPP